MFTPGDTPIHGSSYHEMDSESISEEQEEISWPVAIGIVIAAIGIALLVTPYNLFQVWRHRHEETQPGGCRG